MSDVIRDIKANYREVEQLLSFHYEEIEGEEFIGIYSLITKIKENYQEIILSRSVFI